MDALRCALCLCLLSHAVATNPAPVHLTAPVGEAIIFPIDIPEKDNYDSIIWVSESRQKAVAMKLPGQPLNVLLSELSGRLTNPDQGYSLQFSNLTMSDGGLYTAKNTTSFDALPLKQYWLHVYDIVVSAKRWANGSCGLQLNCTAGAGRTDRVTFSWTQARTAGASPVQGSTLQLLLGPADKNLSYTCTAETSHSHSSKSTGVLHDEFCSKKAGAASHAAPGAGPAWIAMGAVALAVIASLLPLRAPLRCHPRD